MPMHLCLQPGGSAHASAEPPAELQMQAPAPQHGEEAEPAAPSHRTFLSLQSDPRRGNSEFGTDGPSAC